MPALAIPVAMKAIFAPCHPRGSWRLGRPRIRAESLNSDGEDHFQESDEREAAINRRRQG